MRISKRLRVKRDHLHPDKGETRLVDRSFDMTDLRPAAAARAGWRFANVLALEAMHAEGKVSITDEAIAANMDAIIRRACQFLG